MQGAAILKSKEVKVGMLLITYDSRVSFKRREGIAR